MTETHVLIPQNCSFNTRTKQHHTGHIWTLQSKKTTFNIRSSNLRAAYSVCVIIFHTKYNEVLIRVLIYRLKMFTFSYTIFSYTHSTAQVYQRRVCCQTVSSRWSSTCVYTQRIQMMEVVVMASMVPMGMDFWASRRSPERFDPAMIPVYHTEQFEWMCGVIWTENRIVTSYVCIQKMFNGPKISEVSLYI